ncbi:hypothetical protein V6N13_082484 [Hibiscus sabdariffa]
MGAKTFLLTIEDEDLFLLLEVLEWSYLKAIFSEIKPWIETGKFKALGCNAYHKRDWEKATILISTKQTRKIEEVIEFEVGDRVVKISVVEIGFLEASTAVGDRNMKAKNGNNRNKHESKRYFESSLDQSCKEVAEDDQSFFHTKEEALKVMCAEKRIIMV